MRKKVFLKSLAIFVTLALISTMMTMVVASAASWSPSDKITITIRVFDYSDNTCKVIGTDTVTKGDQYIQSDKYKVPPLSKFTSKDYGRVLKVTGNMYGYYTNGCNVGTNLVFTCNANTACLTYWVTGGNTNYGNGSTITDTNVQGTGTKYSWKQTIIYHANYPDGTDKTYKVTYTINSWSVVYNGNLEFYKDCTGFKVPQNYELYDLGYNSKYPELSRCWHLDQYPTIDPNNPSNGFKREGYPASDNPYSAFKFEQSAANSTTHIYAQYTPTAVEYDVKHQDDDGTPLSFDTVPQGQTTDVLPALPDKADGSTFEKWERIEGSTDQKYYDGGETITPTTDVVFEAVYNDPPKAEPSSSEPSSSEPSSSEPSSSEPSSSEPSSSEPSSSEPSSSEPSSSEPSSSEPSSSEPSSSEPSSSEPSSSEPSSSGTGDDDMDSDIDNGDDDMDGDIDNGDDDIDGDIDNGDDSMDNGNGSNGIDSANSNKNNTSVPETGDAFDFFLWISLWTIFGVGTLGFTLYNKKMNSYQKLDMSEK